MTQQIYKPYSALLRENTELRKKIIELERLVKTNRPLLIPDSIFERDRILNVVCAKFEVPRAALLAPGRDGPTVRARFIIAYLLRKMLGYSFPQIGKFMQRDHSTVVHGINVAGKLYQPEIEDIMAELNANS